jgi:hypothetical protein
MLLSISQLENLLRCIIISDSITIQIMIIFQFKIFIDGPYGAPSSHIFRAQHAVLVGTGIGVTPFASILQSIMHRYYKGENIEKNNLLSF